MEKHKLTAADEWFIQKGQIDSLSRSPFSIGDEVVVCDRQHVMLAEFYGGECHTCHSKKLVKFNVQNVEPASYQILVGLCPKCYKKTTIIYGRHGKGPLKGKCPNCNKNISIDSDELNRVQKYAKAEENIGDLKAILIICLFIEMVSLGIVTFCKLENNDFWQLWENLLAPKTLDIIYKLKNNLLSDVLWKEFLNSNVLIFEKLKELVFETIDGLQPMTNGLRTILWIMWCRTVRVYENTRSLVYLIQTKIQMIIEYFCG